MMSAGKLSHSDIESHLDRLAEDVAKQVPDRVCLVSILSGGAALATCLSERLKARGIEVRVGDLDITLYRDDVGLSSLKQPEVKATRIPFSIDDKHVIIVDDVLFSGRTARAALDALSDIGRPKRVELLVLIDRDQRELPIRADYVGENMQVEPADRVEVRQNNEGVWSVEVERS